MKKIDHLLVVLSEESHEVTKAAAAIGQAASKALRFGLDSCCPGTDRTNRADLATEINQLIAMAEMLQEEGVELPGLFDRAQIEQKKHKVQAHLVCSKESGRLED